MTTACREGGCVIAIGRIWLSVDRITAAATGGSPSGVVWSRGLDGAALLIRR
ncbi:MAG: hypothetical protein R3B72_42285 [Polyangiaceae bacterium]